MRGLGRGSLVPLTPDPSPPKRGRGETITCPSPYRLLMLVVMHSHATPATDRRRCAAAIRQMNLTPHPMPGATRTAIGITGNIGAVDPRTLEVLPGVMELIRVTKPYKLASREMHEADTYVRLPQTVIGPGTFTLIAGPCSVENEEMILRTAEFLVKQRRAPDAGRGLQAAHQPVRLPGHGPGRARHPGQGPPAAPASASSPS